MDPSLPVSDDGITKAYTGDDLLSPEFESLSVEFGQRPSTQNTNNNVTQSLENILLENASMEDSIDLTSVREVLQDTDEISLRGSQLSLHHDVAFNPSDQVAVEESISSALTYTERREPHSESTFPLNNDNSQEINLISSDAFSLNKDKVEEPDPVVSQQHERRSFGEEAVAIDFASVEDNKDDQSSLSAASKLVETASTRSLIKFFADDTAGGTDIEGKNFFDTFSTDKADASLVQSSPQEDASRSELPHSETEEPPKFILGATETQEYDKVGNLTNTSPLLGLDIANQNPIDSNLSGQRAVNTELGFSPSEVIVSPSVTAIVAGDAASIEDDNRCFDAWIPSDNVIELLEHIFTQFLPLPTDNTCRPVIIHADPLGDPIYDLVLRTMGEQEAKKRLVLNADSVPQDDVGLRQLIKSGCLRSAVDLTTRLITNQCGQGLNSQDKPSQHTPYSLQLWFTRLSLMVKLRMYAQAEAEMEHFKNLDTADIFYEGHQDLFPLIRGSMVPFSMRLLHAELPQFVGKMQQSLDRLYSILRVTDKILSNLRSGKTETGSGNLSSEGCNKSIKVWQTRRSKVYISICNCLLTSKDYESAVSILCLLLKDDSVNKAPIHDALGRIYLQMGDLASAKDEFDISETLCNKDVPAEKAHVLINKGLLALSNNSFNEAFQLFKEASEIDKSNILAINNMSVCLLYLGKLRMALEALESLIYSSPLCLHETTVLNLCTLYELESSHATRKKHAVLSLINQHKGNGFNIGCLKIA